MPGKSGIFVEMKYPGKGVPPASFARKLGAIVRGTRAAGELQAGYLEFNW
jgi:hypothetical protein